MPRYPSVTVELTRSDGNALLVLGKVRKALYRYLRHDLGLDQPTVEVELEELRREAMSGDYGHLLQTCMEWVNVE